MPTAQHIFWVRYEPRRALTRLLGLSPAAELAHRRLADFVWAGDGWPSANPMIAAQLARVPADSWPSVLAELRTVGWYVRGSALYSRRIANTLSDARAKSEALREWGARGAKARWHGSKPASAQAELGYSQAIAQPCTVQYSTVQHSTEALNADRLTRSGSPQKKRASGEPEFVEDVEEAVRLFSPDAAVLEQTNWGGWWRNRFREHPDKARRVLAEIRVLIKEGTIRKTPGAAAMDLWNRLP